MRHDSYQLYNEKFALSSSITGEVLSARKRKRGAIYPRGDDGKMIGVFCELISVYMCLVCQYHDVCGQEHMNCRRRQRSV